jgi:hypothetical protein
MAKWADYLISAVRFNATETHIDKVRFHEDHDEKVGPPDDMKRSEVVSKIENEKTFKTIFKNSDGTWRPGALVRIIVIHGEKFIRTDTDYIRADNLDNLPRF